MNNDDMKKNNMNKSAGGQWFLDGLQRDNHDIEQVFYEYLSRIPSVFEKEFYEILPKANRFMKEQKKDVTMSMFLSSVDHELDDMIYKYSDITRVSTLSLAVDEIKARKLTGEIAELGVAYGEFSCLMNKLLPEKKIYLFDTFEGFPKQDLKIDEDMGYSVTNENDYTDAKIECVLNTLPYPEQAIVCKGYFPDTVEGLDEQFCLVSIDCDLYKPIYDGLLYFYPRMVKGGYIFVHDYRSRYYRGVRDALLKFSRENKFSYVVIPDNTGTAVIVKQ